VPNSPFGRKGSHRAVGERASKGPVLFRSCTISNAGTARASASGLTVRTHPKETPINSNSKIALAVVAGAALGAAAVQGLHAQAKLKAYSVAELEMLNPEVQSTYLTAARQAIAAAHGRPLGTAAGRVVSIEGSPAPQHSAIVEWDSVDDAVAFYQSKVWTDLAPERDKSQKTVRRYVVEVEK